jgi:hypothetical protein
LILLYLTENQIFRKAKKNTFVQITVIPKTGCVLTFARAVGTFFATKKGLTTLLLPSLFFSE